MIIAALFLTGIVNTLHYALLMARDYPLQPGHPVAFRDLQQAATWADGWMGAMAIVGATGLMFGRAWGRLFGIMAAAALVHMGFIDVSFFAQHGMYGSMNPVMAEMIVVDLWAFTAGTAIALFLWREQASSE